jgi:hypothetical protein
MCQLGCLDTDPAPDSVGIFISSSVTQDLCSEGTDLDADGLSEFCEKQLAAAFAPQLYHWNLDDIRGEPHWAARWSSDGERVVVAYLLSMYVDQGATAPICTIPLPWPFPNPPEECAGHNGDSETAILDLTYHTASQHWVLSHAKYSQHEWYGHYASDEVGYPTVLTYPGRLGGYPRIYVAEGKHAGYATRNECNDGGYLQVDTCAQGNTATRVVAGNQLNIGSSASHTAAQDCMPSSNPGYEYYGSGREECYWTDRPFRGWIPTTIGGGAAVPSYSHRLVEQGF